MSQTELAIALKFEKMTPAISNALFQVFLDYSQDYCYSEEEVDGKIQHRLVAKPPDALETSQAALIEQLRRLYEQAVSLKEVEYLDEQIGLLLSDRETRGLDVKDLRNLISTELSNSARERVRQVALQ